MDNIETATPKELREYARDELGINLAPNMGVEKMRKKIMAELSDAVLSAKRPDKGRVEEVRKMKDLPIEQTTIIRIHESAGPNDINPVPVNVNGMDYRIPRNIPIRVPNFVVEVLERAIETRHESQTDFTTLRTELVTREVPSYPFSVIREEEALKEAG